MPEISSSAKKSHIPNNRALNMYQVSDEPEGVLLHLSRYVFGPADDPHEPNRWAFRLNEDGGARVFRLLHTRKGRI